MNLEIKEPILYRLVDSVVSTMSFHYPELKEKQEYIEQTILSEEQSFLRTLENGVIQFEKIVSSTSGSEIQGKDAFKLYDTYGFPLDLTQLMAEERKMTVDIDGFDVEMKNQKELAKSGQKFEMDNLDLKWNLETKSSHSIFVGYENESISSKIINHAESGDEIIIILENTPFYSESGGQIGDKGLIKNDDFSAIVNDTQKNGDYILHICTLTNGTIGDNLSVDCMIDVDRRNNIKVNHTATHLLHQSLKDVLGSHVNQAGSLVHPEYLRFDITHPNKISSKELEAIELIVNRKIDEDITVETSIKSLEEAKKEGATALFGEKYGDQVRVVTMGKFSKELCGGTHVSSTGKVNKFKIKHDKAISSGVRRINAITNNQVDFYLKEISEELGLQKEAEQKKAEEKQSQTILLNRVNVDLIVSKPIMKINGTDLHFSKVELGIASDLKSLNKKIKNKIDSGIIFLFTEIDKKTTISVGISDDLISKNLKAGDLVKSIASELQGGGGGREDFAMAGIPLTNADDLKAVVEKIILSTLEEI
jgi:alanyl-tRNA synthetase